MNKLLQLPSDSKRTRAERPDSLVQRAPGITKALKELFREPDIKSE